MGEMPQNGSPGLRPRLAPIALALAALFAGLVALQVFALLVLGRGSPDLPPAPATVRGLLWSAGMATGWIGAVALLGGLLSSESPRQRLGLVWPARLGGADWAVAVVGALATSHAADLALRLSGAGRGDSLERTLALLAGVRGVELVVAVLVVGVGTGFAEELFFRGFVQRRLVQRFGPAAGVVGAAGLFALFHFDPQHAAYAFVFGLFVGAAALWTGSTWTAVVLHGVNNTASVLLAAGGLSAVESAWLGLPVLLACGLVVAASALRIRRRGAAVRVDPGPGAPVGSGT